MADQLPTTTDSDIQVLCMVHGDVMLMTDAIQGGDAYGRTYRTFTMKCKHGCRLSFSTGHTDDPEVLKRVEHVYKVLKEQR